MSDKLKFKLTKDEAEEILWGNDPNWERIIHDEHIDERRWAITYRGVSKRKEDGKFFEYYYSRGTGDMGERPWEYDKEVEFTEVFPKEKTIITYE